MSKWKSVLKWIGEALLAAAVDKAVDKVKDKDK